MGYISSSLEMRQLIIDYRSIGISGGRIMQKKLKEIKLGEVFTYGGHEWIKLEQEGFCLMKGLLTLVEV